MMEIIFALLIFVILLSENIAIAKSVGKLWNLQSKKAKRKVHIGYATVIINFNLIYIIIILGIILLTLQNSPDKKVMLEIVRKITSITIFIAVLFSIISIIIFAILQKLELSQIFMNLDYSNKVWLKEHGIWIDMQETQIEIEPPVCFIDKLNDVFFEKEYSGDSFGIIFVLLLLSKIISIVCLSWLVSAALVNKNLLRTEKNR